MTTQENLAFVVAVIVLLGVPGPTNTLLAASGATAGSSRSLRLVPAELGGYLTAITVLVGAIGPMIGGDPAATAGLKLIAAVWLAISAVGLWRRGGDGVAGADRPIGPARVYLTTLFNPKAMVVAFALLPPGPPDVLLGRVAIFAVLVVIVGSHWIWLGCLLAGAARQVVVPHRILRGASVILGSFAVMLVGSVLSGSLRTLLRRAPAAPSPW